MVILVSIYNPISSQICQTSEKAEELTDTLLIAKDTLHNSSYEDRRYPLQLLRDDRIRGASESLQREIANQDIRMQSRLFYATILAALLATGYLAALWRGRFEKAA
jgi:hypothetical protein